MGGIAIESYAAPDGREYELRAPGVAFTHEELQLLGNPYADMQDQVEALLEIWNKKGTPEGERFNDFFAYFEASGREEYQLDLLEACEEYIAHQRELEKALADTEPELLRHIVDKHWTPLSEVPSINARLHEVRRIKNVWEQEKEAREQARQQEQPTAEMEALKPEPELKLSDKKLPRISVARHSADKSFALSITISGRKPKETAKDAADYNKKAVGVGLTAATLATAAATGVTPSDVADLLKGQGSNNGQVLDSDPYKDYAPAERPDKNKDKSLPKLNPYSVTRKTPSEIAADDYDLKPDQPVTTKRVKRKLVSKAIQAAFEEAQATAQNPLLKNNEPKKSQFTREDAEVRYVDSAARNIIARLKADSSLTPRELDKASRRAVQAMTAARFPNTLISPTGSFRPANRFQRRIVSGVDSTIFKGKSIYTPIQQEHIATSLAIGIDDTTPKSHNKHALAGFKQTLNKIVGIKHNSTHTQEKRIKNPEYRLVDALAAVSIIESGRPANPTARNPWGYYGPWQISPDIWHHAEAGWAKMYLGNANAPMSIDNMVKVTLLRWKDMVDSLGSIDAAAAEWLKGPRTGRIVAGSDREAYMAAMDTADGNNTSVREYTKKIAQHISDVEVYDQLKFLAKVKDRNPDFDWDILDKKAPLHSQIRMNELRASEKRQLRADRARAAAARKEAPKKRKSSRKNPKKEMIKANPLGGSFSAKTKSKNTLNARVKWRINAGNRIADAAMAEYKRYGNRNLETEGPNAGPLIRKYTGGPDGPQWLWCIAFDSYIHKKAGYPYKGKYTTSTNRIYNVTNSINWHKKYGMLFKTNSKVHKPRRGDSILWPAHGAIVVDTKPNRVLVAGGNTSISSNTNDGRAITLKWVDIGPSAPVLHVGRLKKPF